MVTSKEYTSCVGAAFNLRQAHRELAAGIAERVLPEHGPDELYSVLLTVLGRVECALVDVHHAMERKAATLDCQPGAFSLATEFKRRHDVRVQAQAWLADARDGVA